MRRILPCAALLCLLLSACAPAVSDRGAEGDGGRLTVAATVFPAYDFARACAGDLADVTLLLPPGMESHSYEPTPADILTVQDCDLFLCLGGESDAWVDTILSAVEPRGEVLRMVDCVELLEEEEHEGHDHHGHGHENGDDEDGRGPGEIVGMDEHVWTSPANAAAITRAVGERLAEIDPANAEAYRDNAENYARELEALDREFQTFFEGLEDPVLVFGDRFPLLYFRERYGLTCYAAFPGCATQTEPSAATIAYLTGKAAEEGISTVWYIEFSNHLVADSIAEAAGAHTAMFHTCHNVTKAELESGATYLTLMEGNLRRLRQELG